MRNNLLMDQLQIILSELSHDEKVCVYEVVVRRLFGFHTVDTIEEVISTIGEALSACSEIPPGQTYLTAVKTCLEELL